MKYIYENYDGKKNFRSYLAELKNSRYVIVELVKRDLKILYTQSVSGPLFYILFPLLQAGVFNFILSNFTNLHSDGVVGFITILSTIIFWNLLSVNTVKGSGIFIANMKLINKIYIPRIIFLIYPFLTSLFHFFIQFVFFLIVFTLVYQSKGLLNFEFLKKIYLLIFILVYLFMLYLSISLIVSSISVRYRDLVYLMNYLMQVMLFLSPIIYSLSDLKGISKILIALNPVSLIPELIRWIFFEVNEIYIEFMIYNVLTVFLLFIIGIILFIKKDKFISDLI
mgnify:CR=1 FL=1